MPGKGKDERFTIDLEGGSMDRYVAPDIQQTELTRLKFKGRPTLPLLCWILLLGAH
jgi:hypothetical protein